MSMLSDKLDMTNISSRKSFIHNTESGMYGGVDTDGCDVSILLQNKEGMDVLTNQHNGWVRSNEYDSNGELVSESYRGRWYTREK